MRLQEALARTGGGDSASIVKRLWYGQTTARPRATWRVVVALAVFVGLVGLGTQIEAVVGLPTAIANLNLPFLVGLVGTVVVAGRLGDRTVAALGLGVNATWLRDLAAGIGLGVFFQLAVTGVWFATGGLSVRATMTTGVAAGALSLFVIIGGALFKMGVVALWEEFIFRSLLLRNIAEGLTARNLSRAKAFTGAVVLSGLVFGIPHAVGAAAAFTNPVFGALQALASVSYFVAAYAVTGSLALPVGIHFASNAWVTVVVGRAGSPYPKLVAAQRTVAGPIDALALLAPAVVLLLLVCWWARRTGRSGWTLNDAYDRVVSSRCQAGA
jgi:hypothetical protein